MRISRVCFSQLMRQVEAYSAFNPSPLSLKKFLDFGRKACDKTSFTFLRKELPVRLANMMQEIHLLPENLIRMPSVILVQSWYERSFQEILEFEKSNSEDEKVRANFTQVLVKIRNRHSNVVPTMAQGVLELKETHTVDQQTEHSIQYFLHRFYMSRISIRMLINQHVTLFGSEGVNQSGFVGCVDPACKVSMVIEDAFDNAKFLCDQYYLTSPDLVIEQHNVSDPRSAITFTYVPSHLHHILFELFKNSLRAVVEHHGTDCDNLPPIHLTLVKGKEDVSLKISDRGGGIPRSLSDQLFHYMYSTAPKPSVSGDSSAPLAGYGYGLPLSRLYARYFHGDLVVTSYEGLGTDASVYLKVLSSDANELLPVFNKASRRRYLANLANHDWSSSQIPVNNSSSSSADQPLGMKY